MAKINRFLAEYSDTITAVGIENTDGLPPKALIRRFLRIFKTIDDSRVKNMIEYPLEEIILIVFLAVLGNASTWTDIEMFGRAKEKWLKKFIKLKNGIPSHDTFRRVFSLIDTAQLQEATVAFLLKNLDSIKKSLNIKEDGLRQICVDGKEQRGTGRKYDYPNEKVRNLQTLHVYDASNEICLYSKAIDDKTNEIPVAQELLKNMNLKGCVVSFDALHTQKETISIIAAGKGDYIGGLKGNQGILCSEAEASFSEKVIKKLVESGDYYESSEKAHGKIEKRKYFMVKARHRFNGVVEWQNLRNFVMYKKESTDLKTDETVSEIRYYITSLRDVETAALAIRGHWRVENSLHWHLDYSFCEDMNATMDKKAFNNYSLINKMALSLCKMAQPLMGGHSIRSMRKQFGWGFEDTLAEMLSCFDAESIQAALEKVK